MKTNIFNQSKGLLFKINNVVSLHFLKTSISGIKSNLIFFVGKCEKLLLLC